MKADWRYPLRLTLGLFLQLREEEAITWKSTRQDMAISRTKKINIYTTVPQTRKETKCIKSKLNMRDSGKRRG